PMVNWDEKSLVSMFEQAGFGKVELFVEPMAAEWRLDSRQIERWFNLETNGKRPTFAQFLTAPAEGDGLDHLELEKLKNLFQRQLVDNIVSWQSTVAYIVAQAPR
ncbi:MAG: AAA family ATPase, partial [Anaerolineae bacterium]|nr:AAA family ATPase [Anaerolineae bacterium]